MSRLVDWASSEVAAAYDRDFVLAGPIWVTRGEQDRQSKSSRFIVCSKGIRQMAVSHEVLPESGEALDEAKVSLTSGWVRSPILIPLANVAALRLLPVAAMVSAISHRWSFSLRA